MVVVLAALLLVSSAVTAWALYDRFQQSNRNRQANALVWHVVICDIEKQVLADKRSSPAEKVRFIEFYDHLLVVDVHAAPCGLQGGKT